ncbi:SusC/RagA family TonB-linked outer membrane protein [Hymenobacter sp. BT664]|uniref:SusC/RagA family TonB-linked outer membrane protein n=1 Tax=Hymenobacter montanus TaxID=2771359 RepID=A0A927BDD6_9BACT|nr:SusC/RagA family TonB-linked outer membrane protein [Hymenobacter montanus]MBD2768225.1 SusC/RagA family TonB-linked outer membrane protein [Hymenobacter montanus]
MKKLLCMVMLFMTGLLQQVYAQDRALSGKVTDRATGQGLPGVTVQVKGTTLGTATNADGSFSLSVPPSASTLIISSIGYTSVEQPIGDNTTFTIGLATDVKQLDEVVVSGLASTVKRSNLANAVASVSAQELYGSTRPATLDAALNGKIVGANISSTSGAPGGGVSVQLRGISTLTGNVQPLYIIDGVYAVSQEIGNGAGSSAFTGASSLTTRTTQDNGTNRISDLNPADIESIEVLKGPSAAAIYGQRANAGVIIIKTKRGAAGQTSINISQDLGFQGIQRYIGHEDFTPEKITLVDGTGPAANAEKAALAAAQASGKIYDYEKEVFGNIGFLRNTNMSISGGSDRTKFYASGSNTREDGIVKNTNYTRSSVRLNVDQKIGSRIDLGISAGYFNTTNRRSFFGNDNNGVSVGYNLLSIRSYDELHKDPVTGLFPDSPRTGDNPLAIVERAINEETTNRVTTSGNTTIRIIDSENSSLRLSVQGGIDYAGSGALLALPSDLQSQQSSANPGVARVASNQFFNYNLQSFLAYDWKLGSLAFSSQVGATRLGLNVKQQFSQGQNLAPGPLQPDRGTIVTQNTNIQDETDVGYVAQQEINFQDRVVATGGIRLDKSSRNGDPKKLYAFPKVSLALNLTKFDFFSINNVSQVKLRAAYGETGGVAFFNSTFSPLNSISTGGYVGLIPSVLVGNPKIGPERATELEGGIDLGFFNNRLSFEATVYNKKVIDIIQTYNTASGTGVQSIRAFPVGDLRNRGLELSLSVTPVQSTNFRWTSTTQFWLNRSLVTRLIVPTANLNPGFGSNYGTTFFALNESPTRWYGSPNLPASETPFLLTRYGEAQPTFQMSYLNSFTLFKNLDVSFLLHWKKDSYTSNLTVTNQDGFGTSKDWSEPYTQPDGSVVPLGEARQSFKADYYIQNSGYVRLREASIYYSLPSELRASLFNNFVKSLRVGVSGNNLLTWTKYKGYDPEVSNFGSTNTQAQVDVVGYPSTRRVFFTLQLGF